MQTDPKTIADMGFNTAVLSSFAIPGGGPLIAATLGGSQMLFDILYDGPDVDPGLLAPTVNSMNNALNKLKGELIEASWANFEAEHRATLVSMVDQVSKVWVGAAGSGSGALSDTIARGPVYRGKFSTPVQEATWKKQMDEFAEPVLSVPSPILKAITWIEGDTVHTSKTLGLYILAGSLWNLLCRLNMAWEFNLMMRDYDAAFAAYTKDKNNYTAAKFLWDNSDPATRGDAPDIPQEPVKPLQNESLQSASTYCQKIVEQIDRFINYVEPKARKIKDNFALRDKKVADRINSISIVTGNVGGKTMYAYKDSLTGETSPWVAYPTLAQGKMAVKQNAIRIAMFDRLTDELELRDLVLADIETYLKSVDAWKTTKDNNKPV
jgi:hypothetical protein